MTSESESDPRAWCDGRELDGREVAALNARDGEAPGVFETFRIEHGVIFFARAHTERMARGARLLALPWPPPWDPLVALGEFARAVETGSPRAFRLTWRPPHLLVEARPMTHVPARVELLLAPPGAVELPRPFGAKTTRRAGYAAARAKARARGFFETLVRTPEGRLVEGTVTNLFLGLEGALCTPPLASGALPGIVREALHAALAQAPLVDGRGRSWRFEERPLVTADLRRAGEVLLTNSLVGVVGVDRVVGEDGPAGDFPGSGGVLRMALAERLERLEVASGERILGSDPR